MSKERDGMRKGRNGMSEGRDGMSKGRGGMSKGTRRMRKGCHEMRSEVVFVHGSDGRCSAWLSDVRCDMGEATIPAIAGEGEHGCEERASNPQQERDALINNRERKAKVQNGENSGGDKNAKTYANKKGGENAGSRVLRQKQKASNEECEESRIAKATEEKRPTIRKVVHEWSGDAEEQRQNSERPAKD